MGSGGCVAPPDGFWPALVELCRELDWLLCVDEVKTGFGRTGHLFAVERWGVEPDLMALGKAMGGGVMPIGAVLGTERAMGFDDLSTGSTWSWLPAACAAALETLAIFEREPVLENVRAIEDAARRGLAPLLERHACIGDLRVDRLFHRARVREGPRDEGARPRAHRTGRSRVPGTWAPRRSEHDVVERPALARDAAGADGSGRRDPGRGDRRSERRPTAGLGVIDVEVFRELAEGLNHPEGVAWNPIDSHVYAGGEAGEIYRVSLEGDGRRARFDRRVDARDRGRRERSRVRLRRRQR